MAAICGGVLGAVATLSVIRYWLAGFAGGGDSGFSALEGLVRTVGAALFIAIWPWLFERAIGLTNLLSGAMLGSGITDARGREAAGGWAGRGPWSALLSGIGLFLGIVVAAAASLLFLGLLLMKIVVSLSTILLFVGMPFAAVLWPIAPWIGRLVGRAFAVCLAVPVLWALCFAAAAALTVDTVTLNQLTFSANGVLNTLLSPLVAIVLLYVMVRLPLHLSRIAMLGGMALGGGFVGRAASYAAGSQMRETAKQHLPEGARRASRREAAGRELARPETAHWRDRGGYRRDRRHGGRRSRSRWQRNIGRGQRGVDGRELVCVSAQRAPRRPGVARRPSGASDPRAYTPHPARPGEGLGAGAADRAARGAASTKGASTTRWSRRKRVKTRNPVTVGEAKSGACGPAARHPTGGRSNSLQNTATDARPYLADQATKDGWWPEEREALRTLTAATPEVRAEALQEAQTDGWITNGPLARCQRAELAAARRMGRRVAPQPRSKATAPTPGRSSDVSRRRRYASTAPAPGEAPAARRGCRRPARTQRARRGRRCDLSPAARRKRAAATSPPARTRGDERRRRRESRVIPTRPELTVPKASIASSREGHMSAMSRRGGGLR